jgi:spermidine synthase
MTIDVVEIDPDVVEIALGYFAVPDDERIRIIVGDGRAFLSLAPDTYDIIIIDAFDDDHVPRPLLTEEFMRDVRDHLSPGGVVAWNVLGYLSGPRSKQFRSLHRTASNVWRHVWAFPVGGGDLLEATEHNIVVLASDAPVPDDELVDRIIDRVAGRVMGAGFDLLGASARGHKVRSGDVPLLVDPPSNARRGRP